jgi:O-antigen/teichoic acid export membrane protein
MHFKRGSLYLTLAWAAAMLSGYIYYFWLTYRFKQAVFGDYQVVMSVLTWLETVVINGLPYTIQKFIGSDEQKAGGILKAAFRLQLWIAGLLFTAAFISAPWISALFRNPGYSLYLRVAFCDILFFGFFHLLLAYQNGTKKFGKQALLFVIYAAGKLLAGVSLVLITGSLIAALVANSAASVLGIFWGVLFLGKINLKTDYPAGPLMRFTWLSLSYLLLLNLLFSVDLWFIKYHFTSAVSGYYGLAGMLARVPYFLFMGVSMTMLPTLSTALANRDFESTRQLFRQALQFLWVFMAPVGVLMVTFRHELLAILFKSDYAPSASIMAILVWGMIALAFFYLNTTLINADHRPRLSFSLVGATVFVDVILNIILIPRFGVHGGAYATNLSCGLGLALSSIFVYRRFQVLISGLSFLRISTTALAMGILAHFSGAAGKTAIPVMIIAILCYFGMLFLIGELSVRELFNRGGAV